MPSPRSSRLNLARYRERAGLRTPNESLAINRCIWQWGLLSPEHRKPATQGELAKALGVRRSYVWRILRRLPFDAPIELLAASPITPAHVLSMRRQHEQSRRQQEEQAQSAAEDWTAAWQEEEARTRRDGYRPDQKAVNECNPHLDDPEERAWRQEEEEVRRIMFPWLYKDKKF
jgi:hypothetical protein